MSSKDILDTALRPKNWNNYIGQDSIKKNLKVIVDAAKKRGDILEHLLFYGYPGLGKTSLAYLLAREVGAEIKIISGPSIQKVGDLAAILSNLEEGSILFLDECHRINKTLEEYLYPAMEDFKINIIVGKGPMAKTIDFEIPRFTLIGATTKLASMSNPLRSRFGAVFGFSEYNNQDIERIINKSAEMIGVSIDKGSLELLSKASRKNPRQANHLLKRVRDFAEIKSNGKINKDITEFALQSLEIDGVGLSKKDIELLEIILNKFNGGPVGIQALSSATNEEEETILNVYEPYLIQLGFIKRMSNGRIITDKGRKYLNEVHNIQ